MLRRSFQVTLLGLILVLVPVSVVGNWMRQVLNDEDAFVAALQDLPADPDVQDAIAQAVAQGVTTRAGLSWDAFIDATVSNPLAKRALQIPNVDLYGFVESQTRSLIQRPEFQPTWTTMVRAAHPTVIAVLLGSDSRAASGTNGAIVLNLQPIYERLAASLLDRGINLARVFPNGMPDIQLTIYQSDRLGTMQRVARLMDRWAIPLTVIAILAMLGVIASARKKLYAGAIVGLVVLASMAIAVIALVLEVRNLVNDGRDPVQRRGALAIIQQVTASLQTWMLVVGIVGAVVMVGCLVAQFFVRRENPEPAWR